jgi:hypothetical protein
VSTLRPQARAFAEAFFSRNSGPPPAARIDWLLRELDDFLLHGGPRVELLVRGGLALATWAAPVLVAQRPPLARLSIEDRCRALDRLEHTPAGLPLLAVKATLCILYYEHPDVMREVGITDAGEEKPGCVVALSAGGEVTP